MQVRVVTGPRILEDLGSGLDELHEATGAPVTARRPWLQAWVEAYPDHDPVGVVVEGEGSLEGAALLARREGRPTEFVALGHGPSDYVRLPARSPQAVRSLAAGVVEVLRGTRGTWRFHVEQLPDGDPVARELRRGLRWALLAPGDGAPRMVFGEDRSPNRYLSRNHRQNVRSRWNRIRRQGLEAELRRERNPEAIRSLLPGIEAVRRQRDRALRGWSEVEDPRRAMFWRSVLVELAHRGEVELTTLHLQGDLAAYVICLLDRDAYRMWDGRVSPRWEEFGGGRLVNHDSVLRALGDRRVREYDWMRGVEDYKLSMSTEVVPAEHLLGWSSAAVAVSWGLPDIAKSVLRQASDRYPSLERPWRRARRWRDAARRRRTRAAPGRRAAR